MNLTQKTSKKHDDDDDGDDEINDKDMLTNEIVAIGETSKEINKTFDLDPMEEMGTDYEVALNRTDFGLFNIHMLIYCGIIYGLSAIELTALSFVLPAAVNEFNLTSTNKGILVSMPMLGMLFGSYFWGCLASTKGRWITLFVSLLMDGFCGIISIFAPNLKWFSAIRFFNGFAISGPMNICFPFLGEFQPHKYREILLCCMEFFWVLGIVILPGIAYAIIPLDIYYRNGSFVFTSWKLYLIICTLPNFILAVWLLYFPESPKFLVEHDETEQTLKILKHMYRINTRKSDSSYDISGIKGLSIISVHKVHSQIFLTTKKLRFYKIIELKLLIKASLKYTARLFEKKNLKRSLILFAIQFGLTCSYYTLMLWFPELFNRYKIYNIIRQEYKNLPKDASICQISFELAKRNDQVHLIQEKHPLDEDVFSETLYLGLACLPLSIIFPFIVHRVGSKFLLGIGLLFDSIAIFSILIAATELQNLILSCLFKLLASISISLLYGITVDLYPAKIRVIAAALGMSIGRLAALLGNLVFGYTIDSMCYFPFITFGILLFVTAVLSFLLPRPRSFGDKNISKQHRRPNKKEKLTSHLKI